MARPALLLLVALSALLAPVQSATARLPCTDPTYVNQYNAIRSKMSACETTAGVVMVLPLSRKQKEQLCEECPDLQIMAQEGLQPRCTVESQGTDILLRAFFRRLFRPCIESSSASDSGSSSDTGSSPSPVVTTATPTATETTLGSPVATTTTTTTAPRNAAPTAPTAPNGATQSPTAPPTGGAGSSTQTSEGQGSASSSMSAGTIIGIIAGGVVVVLVAVIFLLLRRRRHERHYSSDKLDEADLESSTGRASTIHYQFSLVSGSTGAKSGRSGVSGSSGSLSLAPTPTPSIGNAWEDPVIVAARISKDKVFSTVLVSRGGFGEVYRGIYNRQPVAIKTLLPDKRKDMAEINAFLYEVKLMASLEHERIVQFLGVAWDSLNDICAVTEFMEGGDLRGLLVQFDKTGRRRGFDNDKIRIALHVAHAMTYLHSLWPIVLHRDLKSKNILLDTQLNAKLTDFGVSRERSDTTTMTAGVGTSLWMAPEVMLGERYDDKADVFSFGIVLSELDSHQVPYGQVKETLSGRRIPDSAVLQMVSLGRLRVKFTTEDSIPEMVELGNACVALNPRDRPSAADALYTLHNILRSMYQVL